MGIPILKESEKDKRLGATLFRQRQSAVGDVFCIVTGLALILLEFPLAPRWLGEGPVNAAVAVCAALIGAAAGLFLTLGTYRIWQGWGYEVELCEHGVRTRRRGLEFTMLYEEVGELTYRKTRIIAYGSYSKTVEALTLKSADAFRTTVKLTYEWDERTATDREAPGGVSGIESALRHAALPLAESMTEALTGGAVVPWTSRARLRAEGLEHAWWPWHRRDPRDLLALSFRPGFWLNQVRRPWTLLPWERIDRAELNDGLLRIWVKDKARLYVDFPTDLPNFYPGYAVFLERFARGDGQTLGAWSPSETILN